MATIEFIKAKPTSKKGNIYQFRIDLKGAKPPIWRRVLVEKGIDFAEFHMVIQNAFDWEEYHMHQFIIDEETIITDTNNEYYEPFYEREYEETKIKLNKFFKNEGDILIYEYDFGDGWEHIVKLEKIIDKEVGKNYPYLVTGKRVAPIEDCGGIDSWENICEIMRNKKHPKREEMIEYYDEFDPDDFTKEDIDEINEYFK